MVEVILDNFQITSNFQHLFLKIYEQNHILTGLAQIASATFPQGLQGYTSSICDFL